MHFPFSAFDLWGLWEEGKAERLGFASSVVVARETPLTLLRSAATSTLPSQENQTASKLPTPKLPTSTMKPQPAVIKQPFQAKTKPPGMAGFFRPAEVRASRHPPSPSLSFALQRVSSRAFMNTQLTL